VSYYWLPSTGFWRNWVRYISVLWQANECSLLPCREADASQWPFVFWTFLLTHDCCWKSTLRSSTWARKGSLTRYEVVSQTDNCVKLEISGIINKHIFFILLRVTALVWQHSLKRKKILVITSLHTLLTYIRYSPTYVTHLHTLLTYVRYSPTYITHLRTLLTYVHYSPTYVTHLRTLITYIRYSPTYVTYLHTLLTYIESRQGTSCYWISCSTDLIP